MCIQKILSSPYAENGENCLFKCCAVHIHYYFFADHGVESQNRRFPLLSESSFPPAQTINRDSKKVLVERKRKKFAVPRKIEERCTISLWIMSNSYASSLASLKQYLISISNFLFISLTKLCSTAFS